MEYVLSFRFAAEPMPSTLDGIIGAVQRTCEIGGEEGPQMITFGDPPRAALIPSVEEIEQIIIQAEASHVDEA